MNLVFETIKPFMPISKKEIIIKAINNLAKEYGGIPEVTDESPFTMGFEHNDVFVYLEEAEDGFIAGYEETKRPVESSLDEPDTIDVCIDYLRNTLDYEN